MSEPQPCAKCGYDRLYVLDPVRIPNYEYSNSAEVVPVFARGSNRVGHWEAHLCRRCGHAEWYARDLAGIDALVGNGVREVTATAR